MSDLKYIIFCAFVLTCATITVAQTNTNTDNDSEDEQHVREEVHFMLYTQNGTEELTQTASPNVNNSLRTVILIHGWLTGVNLDNQILNITKTYRDLNDRNVIYVDWRRDRRYDDSDDVYDTITHVGERVGAFIINLFNNGHDLKSFHLVGQALGAHISGSAGRYVIAHHPRNDTLRRITALDAAGPMFNRIFGLFTNPYSLTSSDADIVDVTHTNSDFFGIVDNIGTIDFLVNGGDGQPACGNSDEYDQVAGVIVNECSHGFAGILYQMSITSNAIRASSDPDFCTNLIVYGAHFDGNANGTYYIRTQEEAPFATLC